MAKSEAQILAETLSDVGLTLGELSAAVEVGSPAGWWQSADRGCRELEVGEAWAIFFPDDVTLGALEVARGWCVGCPQRQACLVQSIVDGDRHGIWGGLSERRRRLLRSALLRYRRAQEATLPAVEQPAA